MYLEILMTGRQAMTAWGDPHLLLRQLQAFPTATINGTISAKRREVRASPWDNCSSLISQAFGSPRHNYLYINAELTRLTLSVLA
jgi:hypothetical protein